MHPCGHIVYHKDLRREIGVIRVKSKSGNKEAVYAAFIDGISSDKYGYCKSDLLRVDVVKVINDAFKMIGQPVMTADELVEKTRGDPKVWKILADGFTMGCNQTERPKTTERVMRFKPQNTVELAAFIAAIRPGAKSLVDYLVTRTPHVYNIPAMDKLLTLEGATGVTGQSAFLLYDEQIMQLAEAAGIPAEDTNALIKHIKKKHHDDVVKFKEDFIPGFVRYLTEQENTDKTLAEKTAQDVWTVILNSASYLFNLSHAYAMCLDCLYGMYLKAYYPYEFYVTLLKLYSEKKNKDKISAIISEMKKYKGISLVAGRWGQDNRDWLVDKDKAEISQSLSSIRYISKQTAEDLYNLSQQQEALMGVEIVNPKLNKEGKKRQKDLKKQYAEAIAKNESGEISDGEMMDLAKKLDEETAAIWLHSEYLEVEYQEIEHKAPLDCFVNVLRAIQMNTSVKANELRVLIELGYFSQFGKTAKLLTLQREFDTGKNRLEKTTKSFPSRLEALKELEKTLPDVDLPLRERLQSEQENLGLCLTVLPEHNPSTYFVTEVDSKWGTTVSIYSAHNGKSGIVKFRKADIQKSPVFPFQMVRIIRGKYSPRYTYKNGQRTKIPGEQDYWVSQYEILKTA